MRLLFTVLLSLSLSISDASALARETGYPNCDAIDRATVNTGKHEAKGLNSTVKELALRPSGSPPALRFFELNSGQASPTVRFLSRAGAETAFVDATGIALRLNLPANKQKGNRSPVRIPAVSTVQDGTTIRLQFLGGMLDASLDGEAPRASRVTSVTGGPDGPRTLDLHTFERVRARSIYPGIDVVYYFTRADSLTYDVVLGPGVSAESVRLRVAGSTGIRIDDAGNLIVANTSGDLVHSRPAAFQLIYGRRVEVAARFRLVDRNTIGFDIGAHDPQFSVVVDPVIEYSTYLGGSQQEDNQFAAFDSAGAIYVAGHTRSVNFPLVLPIDGSLTGGFDAYVAKLTPDGSAIEYSTFIGGSADEDLRCMSVTPEGAVLLGGYTFSADFPLVNAHDTTIANAEGFVVRIAPSGDTISFSTFIGGSSSDQVMGIGADANGSVFVCGTTQSQDFPLANPIRQYSGGPDSFAAKFTSNGSSLVFSTYFGGYNGGLPEDEFAWDLAVLGDGSVFIAGLSDASGFPTTPGAFRTAGPGYFVVHLPSDGSAFLYSTFVGSGVSGPVFVDADAAGHAVVAGSASGGVLVVNALQPNPAGGLDAFVLKVNDTGTALVYATYLGGRSYDEAQDVVTDDKGNAFIVGRTQSDNFPVRHSIQSFPPFSGYFVFLTKLNPSGSAVIFSTYLGGSTAVGDSQGNGVAIGPDSSILVTGETTATTYPTTPDAFQPALNGTDSDSFVTRLRVDQRDTPGVYVAGSGAWFLRFDLSPGAADIVFTYGPPSSGFVPIRGDFNGDGEDTPGLYDPATGAFFLRNTNSPGAADVVFTFGPGGPFVPVVGDWNADGIDTVGLYSGATGVFFLRNTNTAGAADEAFGYGPAGTGWLALVGDWDGDGRDTVGLYDPAGSFYFLRNTNAPGPADIVFGYGPAGSGWTPLSGDFDGDGADSIGLYDDANGFFFLRNVTAPGPADRVFGFGPPGSLPLICDWNGQ